MDKEEEKSDFSSDEELEQLQYKVVILGDGAVGKTSISMRFVEDYFATQYKQTLGVDWFIKRVVLPGDVHVTMQIWDIGGQTIGSQMIKNYIFGAQAVLLCYDVTNFPSFQNLEDWLDIVRKTFSDETLPYIALVGNKMDMGIHLHTVKLEKHNTFADENNLYSYRLSAKTGDQVNNTFTRIAADLAGIVLTKSELESTATVVQAELINHQRHDPDQKHLVLKENESKCSVM